MKRTIGLALVLLVIGINVDAQQNLNSQVALIEKQVERYSQRVDATTAELIALDKEIEQGVDEILKLILPVKDSTDSKTRVINMKHDVVEKLGNSIKLYKQRRAMRLEEFRVDRVKEPKEESLKAVTALDTRIEKRIQQIMDVTASLTQHEDWAHHDKYKRNGYDNYVETEEYSRHKKNLSNSGQQKSKVFDALQESVEDLDKEIKSLEQKKARAKNADQKDLWEQRIILARTTQSNRKKQFMALASAPKPIERSVGSKGAFELEKWVEEMVDEVASDHRRLMQLGSRRKTELIKLKSWQARLTNAQSRLK